MIKHQLICAARATAPVVVVGTAKGLASEAGFGLVSFLALTPLVIAVISMVVALALTLTTDAKLKHECRTQILESQRNVSGYLNEIIANNKTAKALRTQRQIAEVAVKATIPFPPAHAAAKFDLAAVKASQYLHKLNQLRLIGLAKAQTMYAPRKTTYAVRTLLISESKRLSELRAVPRSNQNFPQFDLIETPKGDASPDYVPAADFTPKQEVRVSVEFDLATILPGWLRALLPQKTLRLKTECNSTLEQENEKWIERLSAGR